MYQSFIEYLFFTWFKHNYLAQNQSKFSTFEPYWKIRTYMALESLLQMYLWQKILHICGKKHWE